MTPFRPLLICLLIFLFSCAGEQTSNAGTNYVFVIAIADGDSFTILDEGNQQQKIRMHGIDAPEKKQPFGKVARQQLSEFIFGKRVRIEKKTIDRYKRIVALVYDEEGRCINEEMLRAGLAWHYKHHDKNQRWNKLELEARSGRQGLWSHPDAVAPWDWRRAPVTR